MARYMKYGMRSGFRVGMANDTINPMALIDAGRAERAAVKTGYALSQRKVQAPLAGAAGVGVGYGAAKKKEKIGKADKKKTNPATNAAITSAGGVVAGTGLLAGGIPGAKSDFSPAANWKRPEGRSPRDIGRAVRDNRAAPKTAPGGIFGFRTSAHRGGLYGYDQQAKKDQKTPYKTPQEAFWRGRNKGKIAPEKEIIRHMGRGKKAANAALIGGVGTMAYGVKRGRDNDQVKKADDRKRSDTYHGALLGAGTAGAGISHYGSKVLNNQKGKWERKASDSVDRAGKLVPNIAGREGKRMGLRAQDKFKRATGQQGKKFEDVSWPKTMYPKVTDSDIKRNPDLLKGAKPRHAEKAGILRGAAAQQRHFAEVYGNTAKAVRSFRTPSAIVAGAGAGGLIANSQTDKSKVKKNLSAFGVEH